MAKTHLFLSLFCLLSFQYMIAQIPSYVPASGLIAYWGFDSNANDYSGNGNNGIVNGSSLTTDRFGNSNSAYSFDGINDFISIPSSGVYFLEVNSERYIGVEKIIKE